MNIQKIIGEGHTSVTEVTLGIKICRKSNHHLAQLLSSYFKFGHAAIGVFEPLNDAIANSPNSFANWNVKTETGMRVLAQHESVVIKGAMQHAA